MLSQLQKNNAKVKECKILSYPLQCILIFSLFPFSPFPYPFLTVSSSSLPAWMHLCPRRPGWCPDGEHLLGALLSGTRHPAGRPDAQPQACGRTWRLIHHLLQWDWGRKVCAQSHLHRPGTHCYWSVVLCCVSCYFFTQQSNFRKW